MISFSHSDGFPNSLLRAACFVVVIAHCASAAAQDVTLPDASIVEPAAAATVTAPVTISGTATDDVAVDFVWLAIKDIGNGSFWQDGAWSAGYQQRRVPVSPVSGSNTTWSYLFDEQTSPGTGTYQVSVAAVDSSGNLDAAKSKVVFTVGSGGIDNLPPDTSITTPARGSNLEAPVIAAGTATDNVGVDFVWIAVRDLDTQAWWTGSAWSAAYIRFPIPVATSGSSSTSWTYNFDPTGSGGSDSYQLFARAEDTSGNADPSSSQVWFDASEATAPDSEPPETTIITPVRGSNLEAPVIATGTATDNAGVDFVWITVRDLTNLLWWNGSGWDPAYSRIAIPVSLSGATSSDWSFEFDPTDSGGSTSYQLFARAVDVNGNTDASSAQVWFSAVDASAGEPPAIDPPDQIHLAWAEDPSSTLTVVWRTLDTSTPATVDYRQAGMLAWQSETGGKRPSGTEGTLHETTLRALTPDTVYEYRVYDVDGPSEVFTARTAPPAGPADFTAVYVADTGLAGRLDGLTTGTQEVIEAIAALEPTFVLPGGDYAYFDTDTRYGTLDNSIDAWFNQMQPVASRSPLMPAYGNHEASEGVSAWISRFPTPPGFADGRIYSFDVGDVHFVSIYASSNTSGIPDSWFEWVEQDMMAARDAGQQWIVPYFHVSPFADGSNHPSNEALRAQLGPLFERMNVKIALASHDQSYERSYPLVDVPATNTPTSSSRSCYTLSDGVTWAKISPGGKLSNINRSFSQFRTEPPPEWTAVRNNLHHHFARLVVAAAGSIRLETYGVSGDGSPPVLVDTFQYTTGSCPPELRFDRAAVSVATEGGGTATASVNLTATSGTASYSVSGSAPWLSVEPVAGSTPGAIDLTVDAAALAPGSTQVATVVATAPGYADGVLPLTLTVGADTGAYDLAWSRQSDRTGAALLGDAAVDGSIYVFVLPDADATQVRFFLDDPGMTGMPRRTESTAPFDFAGGTVAVATPFDSGQLTDGEHTITAAIDVVTGGTVVVHATFTVASN